MTAEPRQLTLAEWDARYDQLRRAGLSEPAYGGPLGRHVADGDLRLEQLRFDNAPASLDLWNFLLTEEARLRQRRDAGLKLIGTMKDLGTVPVMAYASPDLCAFYPDGAWWIPCVMELSAGLLDVADSLGVNESFCPVRAMLGAFVTEAHFPIPDLLICSAGAICDDFSAIAQRLEGMGHTITWWEIPHRRVPEPGEDAVMLPGGQTAPRSQVDFVKGELERVRQALADTAGAPLTDGQLTDGIVQANLVRQCLAELRSAVFTAPLCPMPALEMLIAEMLAIHFCSDRGEALRVLGGLRECVRERVAAGQGYFGDDAARVFWVNPVADIQVMNLLESCGGRICGTEYLFSHALDEIPADLPPMEALACAALADPMVGSVSQRADRICTDMKRFGSEALLVSRIPGASHCALEGTLIADIVREQLGLPVIEIEVPPVSDSVRSSLTQRIEALVETVKQRREA